MVIMNAKKVKNSASCIAGRTIVVIWKFEIQKFRNAPFRSPPKLELRHLPS